MKLLLAVGGAMAVLMVILLITPFVMAVAALTLTPAAVQQAAQVESTDSPVVAPQGGPISGFSPGALIARLPRPPHREWASVPIPLIPLFAKTPPGGFDVGGLPYGQCTWYVARERGIVAHADGKDWVGNLANRGFTVNRRPSVGAIISWRGFSRGYGFYGHVALVVDVDPDGRGFTVAEANVLGEGLADVRWVPLTDPGIEGFVP